MSWEQLGVTKAHYAYLILGGFTSLFMLCSLFVKEKLYIGEATVATICGVVFGPHAANLFNPKSWGNVDSITLECSRIVLVVQCFAIGVELPKAYMERHWRSVTFLLIPVMTYGWLVTSLFIWWMIEPLTWLESLICAACVTATDPVLASSVVGKGKFAKRVPKHLRDILSAESGCNDGMAFPFIYLSYYLIHYRPDAAKVTQHWMLNTIFYECIFGAIFGFLVGYGGRHAIKWANGKDLIDRESFLVFYFVLALFCAGAGSTLGLDDLLVGFAAGVGFSNDGWFTEKTEESHVSSVIDLLLNLAYFVFLGAVIPWEQYNDSRIGLTPWKLVVISIMVIFFRRIPIMLALKPIIPDIKTWREALFAGHFGPIGVGAIFAALLARAELETDTTEPLGYLPENPSEHNYMVIYIIWPLTTFLVITSILVHGSSIAVFTLGKRINQFSLTMSYTQANEEGPSWMNRLPRIASTARSSVSKSRDNSPDGSFEKLPQFPPGTLPPTGFAGNFLRRQREEETTLENPRVRRKSKWDSGMGPGGPITQSAIAPQRRQETLAQEESNSDTLNEKDSSPSSSMDKEDAEKKAVVKGHHTDDKDEPDLEVYQEDNNLVVEDEEGNVVNVHDIKGKTHDDALHFLDEDRKKVKDDRTGEFVKHKHESHAKNEGEEMEAKVEEALGHPEHGWKKVTNMFGGWKGFKKALTETLIVEDEDGEVIKKIDLGPKNPRKGLRGGYQDGPSAAPEATPIRQGLRRMSTWAGMGAQGSKVDEEAGAPREGQPEEPEDDDRNLRFTVGSSGRRLSKAEFIEQLQQLDPKTRRQAVEKSNAPRAIKDEVQADAIHERETGQSALRDVRDVSPGAPPLSPLHEADDEEGMTGIERVDTALPAGNSKPPSVASSVEEPIPEHDVRKSVAKRVLHQDGETAADARRRRLENPETDSEDDGTERAPPSRSNTGSDSRSRQGESAAEKRRRLAALGEGSDTSDSEDDGGEREVQGQAVLEPMGAGRIRFAEGAPSQGRVQWGQDVGDSKAAGVFSRRGGKR